MVSTIADTPLQHRSENKLENSLRTNQLQISVRNCGRFQIAIAFLPSHLNSASPAPSFGYQRSSMVFQLLDHLATWEAGLSHQLQTLSKT